MNKNPNFFTFNLILLQNQNDILYTIFTACAGLTRTLFSLFLYYHNQIVFLILFFLIVAAYITNKIIPYNNNSGSGLTYESSPEMNPKDDWVKFIKDIIIENKVAICVCALSIGTAFYFYSKYQTTNHLFETFKNNHPLFEIEVRKAMNIKHKSSIHTSYKRLLHQAYYHLSKNKVLINQYELLINQLSNVSMKHKSFIHPYKSSIYTLSYKKLLHQAYDNLSKNQVLINQLSDLNAKYLDLSTKFSFRLLCGRYYYCSEGISRIVINNCHNESGKQTCDLMTIFNEIQINYLRKSILYRRDYNSTRLQVITSFFDAHKYSFCERVGLTDINQINRLNSIKQKLIEFISSHPFLTDRDTNEYKAFEQVLIVFLQTKDRGKGYQDIVFQEFFDLFFGYDAVKDIFTTRTAAFRDCFYFQPLEATRIDFILNRKLDFTNTLTHFDRIESLITAADVGTGIDYRLHRLNSKRMYLKIYFFPMLINDCLRPHVNLLTVHEMVVMLKLEEELKQMPIDLFFEKSQLQYFYDRLFYLLSKNKDIDFKFYDPNQLTSLINYLCRNGND
ncbi:MAG: hypothetical protein H0X03_07370 [Nitrosopumilus sp.]|nr:hypothetical protein [Nitrosopumilus sp.]